MGVVRANTRANNYKQKGSVCTAPNPIRCHLHDFFTTSFESS